jgi:hypothetical protein
MSEPPDYLGLHELEAMGYTLADLPPTDLVGLDGSPCWERSDLEHLWGQWTRTDTTPSRS